MNWFHNHADKVILVFLLFIFLIFLSIMTFKKFDEGSIDWARQSATLILGALLRHIVGEVIQSVKEDKPNG